MPDMGDMRQDCLISTASASCHKPHLSNYKAFLDGDVTAEQRYAAIETPNQRYTFLIILGVKCHGIGTKSAGAHIFDGVH